MAQRHFAPGDREKSFPQVNYAPGRANVNIAVRNRTIEDEAHRQEEFGVRVGIRLQAQKENKYPAVLILADDEAQHQPCEGYEKDFAKVNKFLHEKQLANHEGTHLNQVFGKYSTRTATQFLEYMENTKLRENQDTTMEDVAGMDIPVRPVNILSKTIKAKSYKATLVKGYHIGVQPDEDGTETPVFLCNDKTLRTYQPDGKHHAKPLTLDDQQLIIRPRIGAYTIPNPAVPGAKESYFLDQTLSERLEGIAVAYHIAVEQGQI